MKRVFAYIDESGDPHFNEQASLSLEFACILIEEDEVESISQSITHILSTLRIDEIKSSKLKENKRLKLFELIENLDFKYLSVMIDKQKVLGKWKNYPKSFYKYSQKLLNKELNRLYEKYNVTLDRFGSSDYQNSIKKYLEKNSQYNLFEREIIVGSAKDNLLIQLADLIAGTKRKLKLNEFANRDKFEKYLMKYELYCFKWPQDYYFLNIDEITTANDKLIAEISIARAENYIRTFEFYDDYAARIHTLKYLLFHAQFVNPTEYIYTYELINWLKQLDIEINEDEFRIDVIGHFRDEKVIIAGSQKGLKIPVTMSEVVDHLNNTSSKYIKMMKRCKNTIDAIKGMTMGKIDFRSIDSFKLQNEFFKILERT